MRKQGGVVVTRVLETPQAAAPPEQILSAFRFDGTRMLGKASILVAGVPGTLQWNPTLRRYSRQGSVNSSQSQHRIVMRQEPRSIVDSRYPPTGLVLRIRDTLHCLVTGGPPPWAPLSYSRASWGFRAAPGKLSSLNTNQTPFIGFRLDLLGGSSVTDPTWKADFVNWDESFRRSIDTGIGSGAIHDLMVELSGVDQIIRWYVDGNLVESYAPLAGDVGGQDLTPAEWTVCTEVSVFNNGVLTPTLTLSYLLGPGPLTTCLYHDA